MAMGGGKGDEEEREVVMVAGTAVFGVDGRTVGSDDCLEMSTDEASLRSTCRVPTL